MYLSDSKRPNVDGLSKAARFPSSGAERRSLLLACTSVFLAVVFNKSVQVEYG